MSTFDAYKSLELRRGYDATPLSELGRGSTAGWVKCGLCSARRQKRFARGRGLQM
jgi:hypothetical protein